MIAQVNHHAELLADISNQLWLFLLSPNVASATVNRCEWLGKRKPFPIPAGVPLLFRYIHSEVQRGLVTFGISPGSKLNAYSRMVPPAVIQHRLHSNYQTPTKGKYLLSAHSLACLSLTSQPPRKPVHDSRAPVS